MVNKISLTDSIERVIIKFKHDKPGLYLDAAAKTVGSWHLRHFHVSTTGLAEALAARAFRLVNFDSGVHKRGYYYKTRFVFGRGGALARGGKSPERPEWNNHFRNLCEGVAWSIEYAESLEAAEDAYDTCRLLLVAPNAVAGRSCPVFSLTSE